MMLVGLVGTGVGKVFGSRRHDIFAAGRAAVWGGSTNASVGIQSRLSPSGEGGCGNSCWGPSRPGTDDSRMGMLGALEGWESAAGCEKGLSSRLLVWGGWESALRRGCEKGLSSRLLAAPAPAGVPSGAGGVVVGGAVQVFRDEEEEDLRLAGRVGVDTPALRAAGRDGCAPRSP